MKTVTEERYVCTFCHGEGQVDANDEDGAPVDMQTCYLCNGSGIMVRTTTTNHEVEVSEEPFVKKNVIKN